jgi:hypothetical protein
MKTKTPEQMTRDEKLTLIYRHTHKDFKGKWPDGTRNILAPRSGGSELTSLSDLTDEEIADKLPGALRAEEKRLAKKAVG